MQYSGSEGSDQSEHVHQSSLKTAIFLCRNLYSPIKILKPAYEVRLRWHCPSYDAQRTKRVLKQFAGNVGPDQ